MNREEDLNNTDNEYNIDMSDDKLTFITRRVSTQTFVLNARTVDGFIDYCDFVASKSNKSNIHQWYQRICHKSVDTKVQAVRKELKERKLHVDNLTIIDLIKNYINNTFEEESEIEWNFQYESEYNDDNSVRSYESKDATLEVVDTKEEDLSNYIL